CSAADRVSKSGVTTATRERAGIMINGILAKVKEWPCPMCGATIKRRTGPGRQRDYCNKACRRLKAALVDVLLMLNRIRFKDSRRVRADLWTLANTLNE
ncbi:MAG: hypothetical protein V3R83_09590, partial [Gammaproteobacteria bacterium]